MDDFGILTRFRGVAVHDGLMSYQDFGRKHVRCNAHHLRELVAANEAHPEHTWPTIAMKTLEALNTAAHTARDTGLDAIPAHIRDPLIPGSPAPSTLACCCTHRIEAVSKARPGTCWCAYATTSTKCCSSPAT
jgi:hypothetical protein